MEAIIDARVKEVIEFHDCLHGFRSGRGTDTAIIEAKLIQQLAALAGEALFECFTFVRLLIRWTMRQASPSWKIEEQDLTYSAGFGNNKRLHVDRVASMALHFEQEEVPLKVDSSPPLSLTSSHCRPSGEVLASIYHH